MGDPRPIRNRAPVDSSPAARRQLAAIIKADKKGLKAGGLCAEERTKSQLAELRDSSCELPVFAFHGRGAACTSMVEHAHSRFGATVGRGWERQLRASFADIPPRANSGHHPCRSTVALAEVSGATAKRRHRSHPNTDARELSRASVPLGMAGYDPASCARALFRASRFRRHGALASQSPAMMQP